MDIQYKQSAVLEIYGFWQEDRTGTYIREPFQIIIKNNCISHKKKETAGGLCNLQTRRAKLNTQKFTPSIFVNSDKMIMSVLLTGKKSDYIKKEDYFSSLDE